MPQLQRTRAQGRKTAVGGGRKEPPKASTPTQEQIAHRAYEIFQARGGGAGHEAEDWLQAERELTGKA
jgi:hypothetical protein